MTECVMSFIKEENDIFKGKYGLQLDRTSTHIIKKTRHDELIKKTDEYMGINFNDTNHKNYILKLSKRNNYHYDTIGLIIKKTMPTQIITMLKTCGFTEDEISEKILEYNKINGGSWGENDNYKGLFIIKNKKVIGYIVYCIDNYKTEIMYILIDKEYQKQGIGLRLLNYVKEILKKSNEKVIMACIDKDSKEWYLKNGFISEEDYNKKHNYPKMISEKDKVFCDL
jgi:ribosomal protein S18 acetylase RimI-like enzyme